MNSTTFLLLRSSFSFLNPRHGLRHQFRRHITTPLTPPQSLKVMQPSSDSANLAKEFIFFRVYEDGRIEKTFNTDSIPPRNDPAATGVLSKDVTISSDVSARLFLPKVEPHQKLPLLLYIHGGGFCFESAFSPQYTDYVTRVAREVNVLAVSVEYRVAPEAAIPACFDDAWTALKWVASHADGNGQEPWLNRYGDFNNVFVGGDSAGGTITHDVAVRVGKFGLPGAKLRGMVLVHPFFAPPGDYNDEMWLFMCGGTKKENFRVRPGREELSAVGCERVLVFVAEKDGFELRDKGVWYAEALKKSGFKGKVELVEHLDEGHCFHLQERPDCENAVALLKKFASFINEKEL